MHYHLEDAFYAGVTFFQQNNNFDPTIMRNYLISKEEKYSEYTLIFKFIFVWMPQHTYLISDIFHYWYLGITLKTESGIKPLTEWTDTEKKMILEKVDKNLKDVGRKDKRVGICSPEMFHTYQAATDKEKNDFFLKL